MIIALIPTISTHDRGYLGNMLDWLNNSGQVDAVEVLADTEPSDIASARKMLVEQAYAKYGKDAIYLMLNDDCRFTEQSCIRDAAAYFNELPNLGLVGFWLGLDRCEDKYSVVPWFSQCFMFSGEIVAKGFNYTDGEYFDGIDLALQLHVAGYTNIKTKRCAIWHDVAPERSLIKKYMADKGIRPKSFLREKYCHIAEFTHINDELYMPIALKNQ